MHVLGCDFVPVEQNLRTETRGTLALDSVRRFCSTCLILLNLRTEYREPRTEYREPENILRRN